MRSWSRVWQACSPTTVFSSNAADTYAPTQSIRSQAKPIFNRRVTLKDAWAKIEQKGGR